ncbi:MAG TPA: ribokinase [Bryobacteraceae bacterium]|nr:ribokinase [Bryobacteraceae bacterium]
MDRKAIVVIGSSNTDMSVHLARIPRVGETVLGGAFLSAAGGKGANQAVAAARAGGKVAFIARVGGDALGGQAIAGLRREGIDVRCVFRDPRAPSGVALIFVARDGENSIAVASGANARLVPADLKKAAKIIRSAAVVVAQLESPLPTIRAAARMAAAAGVPFILNPAPAQALPDALLRQVSILTPNETEAELLTGITVDDEAAAARAAAQLRDRGVGTVIITLGRQGAFLAGAGTARLIPGFRVKAVDATAAGDTFNGALAVALAEALDFPAAVRFANAAAALSVTRLGAQPSAPARRAIVRMLRRNK